MAGRRTGRNASKPHRPAKARRPRPSTSTGAGSRAEATDSAGQTDVTATKAPPFLVAAVGASAGGLEAFSQLLRGIAAEAPMALILVQHLARDQPSILPELLGQRTKLAVVAARDGLAIQRHHVYVIPPDARMTVDDGHLRVRPAAVQREPEGTVDALFHSVASEYKDRAVGVVLSGSANDGAAGIREIKGAGGLTIAQDPQEAAVNGMPRAAVETGAVDAVLSAEQIGRELTRLAAHPFFTQPAPPEETPVDEMSAVQKIFLLLRRATGVDFSNYKLPTLKRRIQRRLALHSLTDLGEYVRVLERDPSEVARLHEELLIHVTAFFRDPESYVALERKILPGMLGSIASQRGVTGTLRFWVPGCSTGEEVYSLAMLAVEAMGHSAQGASLQIFGTDVSDTTIERARAGVYPAGIVADVSPERLRRFFTKVDGGYRINKELRDTCVFARQDVSRDPPFSRLHLIVCRNLLIYLAHATQRKVVDIFHYALLPDGVLMLGRSESLGTQGDQFSVLDKKFQLYRKKVTGRHHPIGDSVPLPEPESPRSSAGPPPLPPPVHLGKLRDPQTDADRFLLDRYVPPTVIVDADHRILRSRGGTAAFLEFPSGEMTADILRIVRPELLPALRTALHQARARSVTVTKEHLRLSVDGRPRTIDLHVVPLGTPDSRQFLVLFEQKTPGRPSSLAAPKSPSSRRRDGSRPDVDRQFAEMQQQMQAVVDDLGASNEELQSANEEILSSNEELQSTNEELSTAKEELQSTNEELSTLNDELHARNEELAVVNSDLLNVLASVQMPIVIVNRDLRIRRFTPAAEKVLNVIPSDVGRPIGHLKPNFACPDLENLISEVIDAVTPRDRQVEADDGRLFAMQIRPYKSVDNRIDGAVLVMFDVSSVEAQAAALELAQRTGETIMATMHDAILLVDSDLKVLKANPAFAEQFAVGPEQTEGRRIYDLGNGQWDIPALRQLLEEVLPQKKNFDGFAVEHQFPHIGLRRMLVDARRIEAGRRPQGVILLVFRDQTGHG